MAVEITQPGRNYSVGRDEEGYGIWRSTDASGLPLERFGTESTDWFAAFTRWRELEEGRDTPEQRRPAIERRGLALGIFGVALALGVAGLFPEYSAGTSLAHSPDELTTHLFYLAGFSVAALGVAATHRARDVGALVGVGLSIVLLGFYVTDVANALSGGGFGGGLALSLASYVLAAVASVVALRGRATLGAPTRPHRSIALAGAVFSIGAAVAFAPAWDRFVVDLSSSGTVRIVTLGDAFANPGGVIAGNVVTMVLIATVPVLALAWTPARHGVALIAGGLVPLVALAIAAVVQLHERLGPELFGVSASEASTDHLVVSSGFTGAFYIYVGCVAVLALLSIASSASASQTRAPDARLSE